MLVTSRDLEIFNISILLFREELAEIFSPARYRQVIEAFISGLERAHRDGHEIAALRSVASFFVSRIDTEIDTRLRATGPPEALDLRGRAAVANARLAYAVYETSFAGDRWDVLAAAGAIKQRPLWASTA